MHELSSIIAAGKGEAAPFQRCVKEDYPIFSYTSGTTGDSKGVKLTHSNILGAVNAIMGKLSGNREDVIISYLPYPHSFEQCLLGFTLMHGSRIGYFSGDPAQLTADCQVLKPSIFPSVPRLYNRIYGVLKDKMDSAGGCKTWLAHRAIASKIEALRANASYTSPCYDKLVFGKICASLGG